MSAACEWHGADTPLDLDNDPEPGCQNCACLLEWKHCEGCGKDFLDWSVKTWDDVISGPAATSEGDLVCIRCAKRHAADERAQDDYEAAREGDWREYYP